jgi:hypothetical protein
MFRHEAAGKLVGVSLPAFDAAGLSALTTLGVSFVSVALQNEARNSFQADGVLKSDARADLARFLQAADEHGLIVQLVLFHPAQDEQFESTEAIVNAARHIADFLIDTGRRNVILTVAANWREAGWDFDHFVAEKMPLLMEAIRERYQARRTDFTAPLATSFESENEVSPQLLEASDILLFRAAAAGVPTRRVERPAIAVQQDPQGCAAAIEYESGCLVVSAGASPAGLAPMLLLRPPKLSSAAVAGN